MRVVLFVLAVLSLLMGLAIFGGAKSAVQEIEGLISIMIAAILLTGASIIDSIQWAVGKTLPVLSRAPVYTSTAAAAAATSDPGASTGIATSVPKGQCPNCETQIPLDSVACIKCGANFGHGSSWRIRPTR